MRIQESNKMLTNKEIFCTLAGNPESSSQLQECKQRSYPG